MAVQKEKDNTQYIKKKKRAFVRKWAFPFMAVFGISAGGYGFNENYIQANDRFEEAVQAGDIYDVHKYAHRIIAHDLYGEEEENRIFELVHYLVQNDHIRIAKDLITRDAEGKGDFTYYPKYYIANLLDTYIKSTNLNEKDVAFLSYMYKVSADEAQKNILTALIRSGFAKDAVPLFAQSKNNNLAFYYFWKSLANYGNSADEMVEIALKMEISSNYDLERIAYYLSEAKRYDDALSFIEYFDFDKDGYIRDIFISGINRKNLDVAVYASSQMEEEDSTHIIKSLLKSNYRDDDDKAFIYDLVKAIGANLSVKARLDIVDLFSGTLDDNLRQLWDLDSDAQDTEAIMVPTRRIPSQLSPIKP